MLKHTAFVAHWMNCARALHQSRQPLHNRGSVTRMVHNRARLYNHRRSCPTVPVTPRHRSLKSERTAGEEKHPGKSFCAAHFKPQQHQLLPQQQLHSRCWNRLCNVAVRSFNVFLSRIYDCHLKDGQSCFWTPISWIKFSSKSFTLALRKPKCAVVARLVCFRNNWNQLMQLLSLWLTKSIDTRSTGPWDRNSLPHSFSITVGGKLVKLSTDHNGLRSYLSGHDCGRGGGGNPPQTCVVALTHAEKTVMLHHHFALKHFHWH